MRVDHGADEADAAGQAHGVEGRQARQHVGHEEDRAEQPRRHAELLVEPVRHQALHDETPGERIQREERREPQHHALGAVQPQASGVGGRGRRLHRGGQGSEAGREQEPHGGVGEDQHPVAGHGGQARGLEGLGGPAAGQGAQGRGEGAGQVVPGEGGGAALRGQHLRERGLLDGQEGHPLVVYLDG